MKKLEMRSKRTKEEKETMFNTIMSYIKGNGTIFTMTEKTRQYFTWGATRFYYIESTDGCYGIQFSVSGLIHKGRVRIYYNPSVDYFDVELLRPRKDESVYECNDVDCFSLHNILHQHIERTDDVEV